MATYRPCGGGFSVQQFSLFPIHSSKKSSSKANRAISTALVLCLAALIGLTGKSAAAQYATATLSGTVTDATGAVIPGATVRVTNNGTGAVSTIMSDSQGRYRVVDLPVGQYEVEASQTGFQTVVHQAVELTIGTQRVVDFALAIGATQQTVTVTSEVSTVNTTSAQVSTLIDSQQLTQLPLNNRNLTNLILLAPGVNVYTGIFQGAFYGGGFTFSVGGARPNGQAMVLDDSDVQDFYAHGAAAGALNSYLGVDAIGEFQVLTNTYSAQFGGSGSVVNQVTKSGTNQFHGTGYEFFRNSGLDARSWFDLTRTAPFRKNQFGGALGGPIKKDKMFFFVNYEGLRQLYAPIKVYTLPDSNTVAGLLPCTLVTAGTAGSCPTTTKGSFAPVPLVNVGVNPLIAPYINFFQQFFPVPSAATGELYNAAGLPTGTGQLIENPPQIGTENYIVARYDWIISPNNSIFARYLGDFALLNNDNVSGPWHPDLEYNRNQFATIEEKHIISANMINISRFAFSRPFQRSNPASDRYPIFCYYTAAQCATQLADGGFTYGSGITAIGAGSPGPWRFMQNKFAGGEDVFWNHGTHSFKFGGEVKRVQSNIYSPVGGLGSWSFANLQNLLGAVPSSFSGALVNANGTLSANSYRYFREMQYALYVQDDWKVLPTLTLNLGLRWEPQSDPTETQDNLNFILIPDVPSGNFVNPALTASTAYTRVPSLYATNPSLHNFDPRVGVAWDPFKNHKSSVHAGFGLFHNPLAAREYAAEAYGNPPFQAGTALNPPFTVTVNPALLKAATPSQTFGLDYYIHNTPYVEQWNLNLEHEFPQNTVVTLGYVGSHSVHQIAETNENPVTCSPTGAACTAASTGPFATLHLTATSASLVQNPYLNPNLSTLAIGYADGFAKYGAAQVSVNRRMTNNLQAQVSYTYSECIDDDSGSYLVDGGTTYMDPYNHSYDIAWCSFYSRNSITINGVYDLPFHQNELVNGWEISSIYSYHTGEPFSLSSGFNQAPTGGGANRPQFTGAAGCTMTGSAPMVKNFAAHTITGALNAACFSLPPIGFFGTPIGRNTAQGFPGNDQDLTIAKTTKVTKISETFAIQFRAEFFNLWNHPVFGNPGSALCSLSPTGGCTLSGSFGQITSASPGRQVQFGLKFLF
jgi:hypothetical protein